NRRVYCPRVSDRIIGVQLVRGIGRRSATAHDQHLTVKGQCARLTCRSWYAGNGGDRIRHRIIDERIVGIDEGGAVKGAATTRVNVAADGGGRYKAKRDGQDSTLLHPDVRRGSKLPDLVDQPRGDDTSTQNVELVLENAEATRHIASGGTGRPG